jgi:hypothetical protein
MDDFKTVESGDRNFIANFVDLRQVNIGVTVSEDWRFIVYIEKHRFQRPDGGFAPQPRKTILDINFN